MLVAVIYRYWLLDVCSVIRFVRADSAPVPVAVWMIVTETRAQETKTDGQYKIKKW